MNAYVNGSTIIEGTLPVSGQRLDTGDWVLALDQADTATREATGWYEVTDTPRPTPAAGNTLDRSITLVNGRPVVTWTERPQTTAETAADTASTNRGTLNDRLTTRIAGLQAIIDYPAVGDVPAGTMSTAMLSNVARALRDAEQENRVGIQRLAVALRDLHRLARGDFSQLDP